MKTKLLNDSPERTFAVALDQGEEVMQQLNALAEQHRLTAARIAGLGAFESATLGFFDRARKDYLKIEVKEQTEVLVLTGNVALADGKPKLHLHVVLGKGDGTALGGHLLQARVWPTLEITVVESPVHLQRRSDAATGLPLLDLSL